MGSGRVGKFPRFYLISRFTSITLQLKQGLCFKCNHTKRLALAEEQLQQTPLRFFFIGEKTTWLSCCTQEVAGGSGPARSALHAKSSGLRQDRPIIRAWRLSDFFDKEQNLIGWVLNYQQGGFCTWSLRSWCDKSQSHVSSATSSS